MSCTVFSSRAQFVAADLSAEPEGSIVHAGGFVYRKKNDSIVIADLVGWVPDRDVWVEHFGAVTTNAMTKAQASTDDSAPAIQAALAHSRHVHLSAGYYRVGSTLTISRTGVTFVGESVSSTKLFAFHSDPILHVMDQTSRLSRFACLSSAERVAAGASTAVGIRFQVEDVVGTPQRLKATSVSDVMVRGQPSHGVVVSNSFTGTFDRVWMTSNGGHGGVVDRGIAFPTEHLQGVPGLCSFNECEITKNKGHGLAFGHPDDAFTTQALRILVNNCEIGKNAVDPLVRYEPAQVYCRAIEVTFMLNVFKPVEMSGSAGVYIAGRCINMICNRYIGVKHVAMIGSYDKFPTIGVYINGFNVISSPELDTAVCVVPTAGQTSEPRGIHVQNYNYSGGVNQLLGSSLGGVGRVPQGSIGGTKLTVNKYSDQTLSNKTSWGLDDELKFWVTPKEQVRFTVTLEYSGPPESDFKCSVFTPEGSECRFAPVAGLRLNENDVAVRAHVVHDGEAVVVASTNSAHRLVTLKGYIKNGSTGGVVNVGWAQKKSSPNPTTVYAGLSCVEIDRILK